MFFLEDLYSPAQAAYSEQMKTSTIAALFLALAPLSLVAQAPAGQDSKAPDGMAAEHAKAPVPPSKSVSITFEGRITTLTLEDLINLPQVTVNVHNAHSNKEETYTGPLVSDVLAKAGLVSSRETQPLILHSSVVATGTDHYYVLYSAAEVEPAFSTGKVIVAVMKSGLPDHDGGLIQLVNTTDAKPARWVHGLSSLNVMSLSQTVTK